MPARGPARKGLIAGDTSGPQARATPLAADRAGIKQHWQRHAVVPLTAGQMEGDGFAVALGLDVDLGREPAPAPAKRLVVHPPFFTVLSA
jgi:hypothetical protein